ncbi:hypothetical protein TB1_008028 [Malus domestica]
MAEMSRMVGVIGPKGRIMVLVAKHQKLRATIRSFLSMAISMVESLMASWMPKASHSLSKNFSIRLTQVALVEGQAPWGFIRHHFNQSNLLEICPESQSLEETFQDK